MKQELMSYATWLNYGIKHKYYKLFVAQVLKDIKKIIIKSIKV